MTTAWIDASAGVAGDMLLGALLDAGASLPAVRDAVEAVAPGEVHLDREEVTRAGLRATRAVVAPAVADLEHRTWRDIRALIGRAALAGKVREHALSVFERLATAEARVHGTDVDEVSFHEVGAWDSIADVVGVCAALHDLGVTRLTAGPVAVGTGRVATAHGDMPVPVPAVTELAAGWQIFAGGDGELATPTGMALVTALARPSSGLPPMRLLATGTGAGGRDVPGRPNVVRVLVGVMETGAADEAVLLETNIDDQDPRTWPSVLSSLLETGASDAWLVPILMKKGRPAHTLCVLCPPGRVDDLRGAVLRLTTTLGLRERTVRKTAVERGWTSVAVLGTLLPIKVGHSGGAILQATPEFEPAAALAAVQGLPVREVLDAATAAAHAASLVAGSAVPPDLLPEPPA